MKYEFGSSLFIVRQAIGNFAYGIWKFIDNSQDDVKNQTSTHQKRAPAFASKYSLSEIKKYQKENPPS